MDRPHHPGGTGKWTLESLEKHLSARLDAQEVLSVERHARSKERVEAVAEALNAALTSIDKAVEKSEQAENARYHSLNELRGVLSENIKTLLPRTEYATNHAALDQKITAQRESTDEKLGLINDRISSLDRSIGELGSSIRGKAAGIGSIGGLIVGSVVAIAGIASIASLFIALFHR